MGIFKEHWTLLTLYDGIGSVLSHQTITWTYNDRDLFRKNFDQYVTYLN